MSRNSTPPSSSSSSSESMSDSEMEMMDLAVELEREMTSGRTSPSAEQQDQYPQRTEPTRSSSPEISAVEQALNLMTLTSTNNNNTTSSPRFPTEEELLLFEDPHEALRAGNELSLSAQVHLEKARRIWLTMGHVDNADLLSVQEKLEVDGRYAKAEQALASAAQIQGMALVWIGNERARLREKMK